MTPNAAPNRLTHGVTSGMDRRSFLLASLVLFLGGCGGAGGPPKPPAIKYGRDVCAMCGMIISDERFAAAALTPEGDARLFDDIGDLVLYVQPQNEKVTAAFVHDYGGGGWLAAFAAWYVHSATVQSPMAYGLAAFSTEDGARKFALDRNGEVHTWNQLLGMKLMRGMHSH